MPRAPSVTDMREDSEDIENRLQGGGGLMGDGGAAGPDGLYGGAAEEMMENGERGIFVNIPPKVRRGRKGSSPHPVTEKDMNTVPPDGF